MLNFIKTRRFPFLCILCAYLFCLTATHRHIILCPVSSHAIHTQHNGYQGYLLDFTAGHRTHGDIENIEKNLLFQCEVPNIKPFLSTSQLCSPAAKCPLVPENLDTFLMPQFNSQTSRVKLCPSLQIFYHSQYPLNESKILADVNEVRVIVFGGSATLGHNGYGCVCLNDTKCPSGLQCKDGSDTCFIKCAWPNRLHLWLQHVLPSTTISVRNLARAGYNSEMTAMAFDKIMTDARIERFTSRDIIFLDFSANDEFTVKNISRDGGLEDLVRLILSFGVSNAPSPETGSPAIIVLETNPDPKGTWPTIYRAVAKYYEVSIWSWKELAFSAFAQEHQSPSYLNWFQYRWRTDFAIHPPWFVHLMWADMIAAAMLKSVDDCHIWITNSLLGNAKTPSQQNPFLSMMIGNASTVMPSSRLIPSLYQALQCRSLYVDISAEDVYHDRPSAIVGSVSIDSVLGWKLLEDKPGKFGWVESLHDSSNLVFSFIKDSSIVKNGDILISVEITYLRTYWNAGVVDVFVCGQQTRAMSIDAWWPVSMMNDFHISIPQVIQLRSVHCPAQAPRMITFKRRYVAHASSKELIARNQQKFKVIRVKVCAA